MCLRIIFLSSILLSQFLLSFHPERPITQERPALARKISLAKSRRIGHAATWTNDPICPRGRIPPLSLTRLRSSLTTRLRLQLLCGATASSSSRIQAEAPVCNALLPAPCSLLPAPRSPLRATHPPKDVQNPKAGCHAQPTSHQRFPSSHTMMQHHRDALRKTRFPRAARTCGPTLLTNGRPRCRAAATRQACRASLVRPE